MLGCVSEVVYWQEILTCVSLWAAMGWPAGCFFFLSQVKQEYQRDRLVTTFQSEETVVQLHGTPYLL